MHPTRSTQVRNARHPQILYWFWQPRILENQNYLQGVRDIAARSPFDLIFLTARDGLSFFDTPRMAPVLRETVDLAHQLGLKIGLQLWPKSNETPTPLPVTEKEVQGLVVEQTLTLDDNGCAAFKAHSRNARNNPPLSSSVLAAFAYRKASDGGYVTESLQQLAPSQIRWEAPDATTVIGTIDAGHALAGHFVYLMTLHLHHYLDPWGKAASDSFTRLLEAYSDIPLDGCALDEYSYMRIKVRPEPIDGVPAWRERFYSPAFAQAFSQRTGRDLLRTFFEMRHTSSGDASTRIKATNLYFDVQRHGPLVVENAFYQFAKKLFGESTFIGVHNTFHNQLTNDEIWATGCNWWDLPREYGQTDEDICMPVRLGVAASHPQPIHYDMYYARNVDDFCAKAIRDARYGGRIHYHAYDDGTRWGLDLRDEHFLANIRPIEEKIRLLNHFNGPLPRLSLLLVFGYEALTNWWPDSASRNAHDLNGSLNIMEKAQAVWEAGFPCALVPSHAIEDGRLVVDDHGRAVYCGHSFDALMYLNPQYAKTCVWDFLERLVEQGGRLMLEGDATHDFSGRDVAGRYRQLKGRAAFTGFDLNLLDQLGGRRNDLSDGCRLEDGSVVLTDLPSIRSGIPKPFCVTLGRHQFSGAYIGVMALLTDGSGEVRKFVCGGFTQLLRNGQVIQHSDHPVDWIYLPHESASELSAPTIVLPQAHLSLKPVLNQST